METEKDKELWRVAKKRVGFKRHLASYLIINAFLWGLWWFSKGDDNDNTFPWPAWTSLGWGIGVAFDYMGAYMSNKPNAIEKEYQKLKNQ